MKNDMTNICHYCGSNSCIINFIGLLGGTAHFCLPEILECSDYQGYKQREVEKDTLPELSLEGDFNAKLTLDNNDMCFINETASRFVNKYVLSLLEERIRKAIDLVYGLAGKSPDEYKDSVKKEIESFEAQLIADQYKTFVIDLEEQVKKLIEERLNVVRKVVISMATPEKIESLLTEVCEDFMKGKM